MQKRKERLLLIVIAAVQFIHIMDFMIIMPLGPQLMNIFDINSQSFGLLVSSYTFSASIFGFLGAFFLDRFDRKKALFVLYLGFSLGTFACALAPSFYILLLARVLTGMFGGVLTALLLSMIGDAFPLERRGEAMGIFMTAFSVASVLGVPTGIYLAAKFNWHVPFYLMAVLCIPVLFAILYGIPSMRKHIEMRGDEKPDGPLQVLRNNFSNKNQLWALALNSSIILSQFMIIPYIANYMVFNVGFSEEQISLVYLLGGVCTFFSGPLLGRWSDKIGAHSSFLILALCSLVPILLITQMGSVSLAAALTVSCLFFIFIAGRGIPANTLILSSVKARNRGSFMSIKTFVQQLSTSIASLAAGWIIVENEAAQKMFNFDIIGYIGLGLTLVSILVSRQISLLREEVPNDSAAPSKKVSKPKAQPVA